MSRSSSESEGEYSSDSENNAALAAQLKSSILRRIQSIHGAGSFSTATSFDEFPIPGIIVEDVGAFRLPLSKDDAQRLIQGSRKAPFGKGNLTLVDETVRKTWEIDAKHVNISNKHWNVWLEGVVKDTAEDLGVASGPDCVRAELYKMLLYEEGAMFKPHQDTEKTPGMFGTFVICLPSKHTGGAVRLQHKDKEHIWATAEDSEYKVTSLAWYADVVHEIEPVESGYRWVLTYNLIDTVSNTSQSASAAKLDSEIANLAEDFEEWDHLHASPCLCYALSHEYTTAGLHSLKGDDHHQARFVIDACQRMNGLVVLLAGMNKTVIRSSCEEQRTSTLTLLNIVDLEGFVIQPSLEISRECLLQSSLYMARNYDEHVGGEYYGNSNADVEEIYRDTVVLLVRKADASWFFLRNRYEPEELRDLLQRLQAWFIRRGKDPFVRELIIEICQQQLTRTSTYYRSKDLYLAKAAFTAASICEKSLFHKIVHATSKGFNIDGFSSLGKVASFQNPRVCHEDLTEAFSRISEFHYFCKCLQAFLKSCLQKEEDQTTQILSWGRDRLSDVMTSLQKVSVPKEDAVALVELIKQWGGKFFDDNMFDNCIKKFISRLSGSLEFLYNLTVELLNFLQDPNHRTDNDIATRILRLVLDAIATRFELQTWLSVLKSRDPYSYSTHDKRMQEAPKDANITANLHQNLLESNQTNASILLSRIQSQFEHIEVEEMEVLTPSLLREMIPLITQCPLEAHQFFLSVMTTYITRVVLREPRNQTDWARPNHAEEIDIVKCPKCQPLRDFLLDPSQESCDFPLPEDHNHLKGSADEWSYRPRCCEKKVKGSWSSPVLTVTKFPKPWDDWYCYFEMVQKELKRLPEEPLRQCLGAEYDALMNLDMVRLHEDDEIVDTAEDDAERSAKRARLG